MSKSTSDQWLKYFFAYCIFKKKKGNDAIPDKNSEDIIAANTLEKDLSKWIRKQNRDRSSLSPDQLAALNHVGIHFAKSSEEQKDQIYEALVAYKNEHGNLLVPQTQEMLGKVVMNLQAVHKIYQNGEETTLTNEYIQELNGIGFVWVVVDIGLRF